MEKTPMIYQSNAITEGRYQFDLIEKRIVYFIINECRKQYVETQKGQRDIFDDLVIQLPVDSIRKADTNIKRVYDSARNLRKKDIEINTDSTWLNVGFINYTKHNKKTNTLEVGVSKEILPYLVELTERFTSYQLAVAITLKSTYTQRMYEICSQWKNKGYCYYKLENLRRILKCEDKFKTFGEFRRGVLEISAKELKENYDQGVCDLWFEWEILDKERKKVKTLEFKIKTKENNKTVVYTIEDLQHFIRNMAQASFPKDKEYVSRIVSACGKDYDLAEKLALKLKKKQSEYSIKELPAILRYILKEDFQII